MKKHILLLIVLFNSSFVFCTKYKIQGSTFYKLDNTIELNWFNIDSYKSGQFKPSEDIHDTLYWGDIYTDETTVFFCTNDDNEKIINKIEFTFYNEKIKKILHLLKKYHNLQSKNAYNNKVEYIYTDPVTNNKIIAEQFQNKVVVKYISGLYENFSFIENKENYKTIIGTDGFYLHMPKDDALRNAEEKKYIKFYETNNYGINRIYFRKNEKESDYWAEALLEYRLENDIQQNPFVNDTEHYFTLDFILDEKNDYILSSYYSNIVWKSSLSLYSHFISPLTEKYYLAYLNTINQKNDENLKNLRFRNLNNSDYLDITFIDPEHTLTKNIIIQIHYSISDELIQDAKDKLKEENKSIVDLL